MSATAASDATYSHDATVAAITSYYTLVSRIHAYRWWSELRYPPPGGWPQINREDLASLERTDVVMELMRHIPYFDLPDQIQIMAEIVPASYIEPEDIARWTDESRQMREGESVPSIPLPPHILCIGSPGPERKYGSGVYVDTKHGCIIIDNWHGIEFPLIGVPEDAEVDPEDEGLLEENKKAWRIETFFHACEKNLKELKWFPCVEEGKEGWIRHNDDGLKGAISANERKRIIREAGWPGENWNAEAARKGVLKFYGCSPSNDEANKEI